MTTTNTHQINWFLTAGTLRAAFTQDKRQDGTLFWCLTDQARATVDDLTEWLHELHDDELPNDWRYETIVAICEALQDVDAPLDEFMDHHDLVAGIADNITDIYNADLLQWYAENTSRLCYIEQAEEDGIINKEASIDARLTIGQNECIRSMCHRIIDRLVDQK
tara:strand:+ start:5658 stop:6149 length:492 start_codon:yes stop_codon:yes gene_type:complete